MLKESLLWTRTIDPVTGKIVKEETFLNAALTALAAVAVVVIVAVLVSIL